MLLAGRSLQQVATAIGVNQRTLYRWMRQDRRFIAAYNRWQQELETAAWSMLTAAAEGAARTLLRAATAGNIKAALMLLKRLGILAPHGVEPAHPINVPTEMKIEEKQPATDALGDAG